MDLPSLNLGDSPINHEHSCLGLSGKFLNALAEVVAPVDSKDTGKEIVLSVGSGTGLVEALLAENLKARAPGKEPRVTVEGVEVHEHDEKAELNKYLSEQFITKVHGSWEVSPRVHDPEVTTLMFIYPRHPDVLSNYIKAVVEAERNIKTVVWLGPCNDWNEYEPCFAGYYGWKHVLQVYPGEDIGLNSFEIMAVWRK